jgi:hypothetical protein
LVRIEPRRLRERGKGPIGQDRAKKAVRKRKGKEDSTSQSRSSFSMGDIMSTLKKLVTSFITMQMWKQHNKLCEANTAERLIKKDLNFVTQNAVEIQDENNE